MADEAQVKKHPEPEHTRKKHIPLKEYGLMKTWEWPDGTIITLNTKKGEECMRIHHSSGVYHEFTSEGTQVSFQSNNSLQYAKNGMTVTMDASSDTKAAGHMRIAFDHDSHVEFKKNASIVVGGHADIASLGHLKMAAKGNIYLGADKGKIVLNGGKGVEIKGEEGRVMIEAAKGVLYLHSKEGDVHTEAKENIIESSGKSNVTIANENITEQAKQSIGYVADENISQHAKGSFYVQADADVEIKGGMVKMGGGNEVDIQASDVKIGGGGMVEVVSGTNLVNPPWVSGGSPPSEPDDAPEVSGGFVAP